MNVGTNFVRAILVCVLLFAGLAAPAQAVGGEGLAACFAEAPHLAHPGYAWQIQNGRALASTGNPAVLRQISGLSGRAIFNGQDEREPFETPRAEWSVAFQFFLVTDPANVGPGAWDSVWFYEVRSRPGEYYAFGYSWARLHSPNGQHPCAAFAVSQGVVQAIIGQMR